MLKERLMNPGSYFRFGWQRETERVVLRSTGEGMDDVLYDVAYHKGHVR